MKILVNGIKKELVAIDRNGIDWTQDLLGNANALNYNEDLEQYTMSDDDFNWWSKYIDNANADDVRIAELVEQFGDEVAEVISEEFSGINDYGDHHSANMRVFARFI